MIKIAIADKNFESCDSCIHSDDSETFCFLMRCIHAVSELHECYQAKIVVGDEVKIDGDCRATVLDIDQESFICFTENGCIEDYHLGRVEKTGRHFSEIADVLKKMQEGEQK